MFKKPITRSTGFSLLELLCAMSILMIVSGAAMYGLVVYQKSYTGTSMRQNMQASVRSATELLQQEIGQAGALSGQAGVNTVTITAPATVTASAAAQTITLSSTTNMFEGENLQVDLGANQESVAITAIVGSTITGVFTKTHSAGALVSLVGMFPQGILSASDANHLYLIGDINSDGNLYYVVYTCTQTSTPPYGTLTRSITQLPATTVSAADTLVQNVVPNPDGSACFSYATSQTVSGYTFIPGVGITLSTQLPQKDPQSQQYVTVTNSFLNLSPRNILYGLNLATSSLANLLQPLPLQGTDRP
jgi:type II secretory pathway pseudopilin PulG